MVRKFGLRTFSPHGLFRFFLLSILPIFYSTSLMAEEPTESEETEDRVSPDADVAGILNTEIIPEGRYQADLTTGQVWFGLGRQTNLFTNLAVNSLAAARIVGLSLGGKHRFHASPVLSSSMLGGVYAGTDLRSPRKRLFGTLLQQNNAFNFGAFGRMGIGFGGAIFTLHASDMREVNFEDRWGTWLTLTYDIAVSGKWSFGSGFSPLLQSLYQSHIGDDFIVTRLGFAGGKIAYLRTQFAADDWLFAGGAAAFSVAGRSVVLPLVEIIWRRPENLFSNEEGSDE